MAFVIAADLPGPGVDLEGVAAATAYVSPALEIVGSRIVDWQIALNGRGRPAGDVGSACGDDRHVYRGCP